MAWLIRFGCDDAYISFVYARNLVRGDGLTWFGDHVEGYTNFGWVLWVAGGLDPLVWAWAGSLTSLAVVIVVTYRLVRVRGGSEVTALCAVGLLATNFTFLAFGTSGLETMLQTALLATASWLAEMIRRDEVTPRRLALLSTTVAVLVERGMISTARLEDSVLGWMSMFLGPAVHPVPVLDLVAVPLDDRVALLMWYLRSSPEVSARIERAGWERRRLTLSFRSP